MSSGMRVERKFHFRCSRRHEAQLRPGEAKTVSHNRIPRVSRLMALAIRFDQLLATGALRNQHEIAKLGCVSRARVTHIMNLLNLAPDLQEWLLETDFSKHGRDIVSERQLRPIAAQASWRKQRQLFSRLVSKTCAIHDFSTIRFLT
jgi:hypothetical protein